MHAGWPAEAYRASLPWSYHLEKETDAAVPPRPPAALGETEALEKSHKEDQRLQLALETEAVRLFEAAIGTLPSAFAGLVKTKRHKHHKEKLVPFSRLREYGARIEEANSCGTLQTEISALLRRGWRDPAAFAVRPADIPKGVRVNPNYEIAKENLQAAAAKLRAARGETAAGAAEAAPTAAAAAGAAARSSTRSNRNNDCNSSSTWSELKSCSSCNSCCSSLCFVVTYSSSSNSGSSNSSSDSSNSSSGGACGRCLGVWTACRNCNSTFPEFIRL
ncbi:hypothetical protein Efla_003243 [Eimeria flavescens]